MTSFPDAARIALGDGRLRHNLRDATTTIRDKRARVVAEVPDWEELREAGRAIKEDVMHRLDEYLFQFEAAVLATGGHVHWARDAAEANAVVLEIARAHGAGTGARRGARRVRARRRPSRDRPLIRGARPRRSPARRAGRRG